MSRRAALAVALASLALPVPVALASPAPTTGANARYALANGCYALKSKSLGRLVAKSGGGAYNASAGAVSGAEPIRMQATGLGTYLLFGRQGDFIGTDSQGRVRTASAPSDSAEWKVEVSGGAFRISLLANGGKVLGVSPSGDLGLGGSGDSGLFSFETAGGCANYPEVELNVTGKPHTGSTPYTEVSGLVDGHMHMMAYEFLGGRAHCARPWHKFGAPSALVDCPDHYPGMGGLAILEDAISDRPGFHDPVGWPTFKDWPRHDSLTHEQSYYRWLERSWRAGQRVFVNLFVENKVLCEIYPYKQNSCNEMDSVRLQNLRIRQMQDYIDAQSGGPGKGFFRIVTNPFQAREVINAGKLAVVLGIEVSEPFGCQVYNDEPKCDKAQIDRLLNEVHGFGVRQMEIINKFDNALAGVAGDSGSTGLVVNSGNKFETGKYWQMQACQGPQDEQDKHSPGVYDHDHHDLITAALEAFLPTGAAPIYPTGAQCNARGLTELGDFAVRRMMDKKIIIDPDHLSVRSRKGLMDLLEARRYSGVISSHSWSSPDVLPRIYNLGGLVTPYAGDSTGFVKAWRDTRKFRNKKFRFGFGWGADMNGFGGQGGPRAGPNGVTYPFKSFDGNTVNQQHSGQRVYDFKKDGVAHYGMYPDWVEDLRKQAGPQIVKDMAAGAEAYVEMWERADGVPRERCRSVRARFSRTGLGRAHLRATPEALLRRAGQPASRKGRVFRWCVGGRLNRKKRVAAVFTSGGKVGLIASNAAGHSTVHGRLRVSRGTSVRKMRHTGARRISSRLYVKRLRGGIKEVYGVRRGKVRYVAVASRSVGRSTRRLRAYLRLSGVR